MESGLLKCPIHLDHDIVGFHEMEKRSVTQNIIFKAYPEIFPKNLILNMIFTITKSNTVGQQNNGFILTFHEMNRDL